MGDKGQKDKDKGQKQRAAKDAERKKKKGINKRKRDRSEPFSEAATIFLIACYLVRRAECGEVAQVGPAF